MTSLQPDRIIGATAIDSEGDKIGKIGQVYLDDRTGQPAWVTVSTGLFGTRQSFAPLSGATSVEEDIQLTVTKDQIKDAPNIEDDGHISPDEGQALFAYYAGVLTGDADSEVSEQRPPVQPPEQPARIDQQATDQQPEVADSDTDDAMTRSEERLHVGTETVESGRARLRKYVVTENVTQTVPVSHEEVRVEREPITDANVGTATDGPAITEDEHEITLHAERPVVQKETVPVERVRMSTETVSGEEQIDDTVRKEQIDVDGADDDRQ